MTPTTPSETTARRNVAKLQRAIVDGLQDVKAQDIQVFNTEHLSPLFERVIVASGSSNRQTKALAASVRDAVRGAGFAKPRTEGEANGEWIIVDCGAAVAHIMQPAIRQYYRLEELWGEQPVRLKPGAAKPLSGAAAKPGDKKPARKTAARPAPAAPARPARKPAGGTAAARPAATRAPRETVVVKPSGTKKPAAKATPARAAAKPATPRKAPTRKG